MSSLLERVFFIILLTKFGQTNNRCTKDVVSPVYHLIAQCHRSKMSVVARANYMSLRSCKRLATERKALAFNFSPPEVSSHIDLFEDTDFKTCQVLECPESEIGLSLTNDTRFDYYSMYADPLPSINSTCLPGVGIFSLEQNNLNYTDAEILCMKKNGTLANPTSDLRTNALSNLVSFSGITIAYIGLNSLESSGVYKTTKGNSLDCTTYRAWAPGHPKRSHQNFNCVSVDSNKMWRAVKCSRKIPQICEILTNGPYIPGSMNITCIEDNLEHN